MNTSQASRYTLHVQLVTTVRSLYANQTISSCLASYRISLQGPEVSSFYPLISSGKPVILHIELLAVLTKWPEVAPTRISILRHLLQRYIAGSLFGSQFLLLLSDAAIPGVT